MNYLVNPFQHLYVTERVGPKEFVKLVSPVIIPHVQELYHPGNVFLLGTQGSGKSTLLALLKAEIRTAYYEQGVLFPLDDGLSKFFSAGINLNTSDALAIGQIPIEKSLEEDFEIFPLYFADFFNYWVIHDILEKLVFINAHSEAFNFEVDHKLFDTFASKLISEDCWFNFLDEVTSFADLVEKIKWRISQYRAFSQYNIIELPVDIQNSKTNIGEPISKTVKALKDVGVIEEDVSVLIRVDEVDRLNRIDSTRNEIGREYRRIINRAISKRDKHVSYKIALRTYAFNNDLKIYKSNLEIENKRDFSILDIDEILRQEENKKTWLFPEFAYDVFHKRLTHSFKEAKCDITNPKNLFDTIFGKKIPPSEIAKERYAKTRKPEKGIVFDQDWPECWTQYLSNLYKEDPLSAKLGSAWIRQKTHIGDLQKDPAQFDTPPWESQTYWKKERNKLALMQLASKCGQRMFWAGEDQMIGLSSGGILIFVSLCQMVWDTFLRAEKKKLLSETIALDEINIPYGIQSLGIFSASNHWVAKISELPGGDDRKRFAQYLGAYLRKILLDDTSMSNPGCNGFSLKVSDYEADEEIQRFLDEATSYGVLVRLDHTDKNGNSPRYKFFLNKIYCPSFQIFHEHTKEPLYVNLAQVQEWVNCAINDIPLSHRPPKTKMAEPDQHSLFSIK